MHAVCDQNRCNTHDCERFPEDFAVLGVDGPSVANTEPIAS